MERKAILQKFNIAVQYKVFFSSHVLNPANALLGKVLCRDRPTSPRRVLAIIDQGVAHSNPRTVQSLSKYFKAHKNSLRLVAPAIVVPGGEAVKETYHWVHKLQKAICNFHVDRHAIILIIGGGAVLDMAGFASATSHRGIRLVRVPTTLLSQADGGLGVKNGINRFGVKNFLGTFTPPFAVLNDRDFLGTLKPRYLISGMAEAIKVALIRDGQFFDWLECNADSLRAFESSCLDHLVYRSATIHLDHISKSGDPFEMGSVRPLDFGHWAAHKLESLSAHDLHHGEAVAVGMAIDSYYSTEVGLLKVSELNRILNLLDRLGLPTWHHLCEIAGSDGQPLIFDGLTEFREHIGGDLTITLLKRIGEGKETKKVDRAILKRALSWLKRRHMSRCASR